MHIVTLSPCAVDSCPIPGDNSGITSSFGSISGVPSHAVNGRSFYGAHIPQPSCSWPTSPSLPTHLPEHHIVQPSCYWPSSPSLPTLISQSITLSSHLIISLPRLLFPLSSPKASHSPAILFLSFLAFSSHSSPRASHCPAILFFAFLVFSSHSSPRASHCPAILFMAFPAFSSHSPPRASHDSPFRVPLSPHVQSILKLRVPPSIPVSVLA